MHIRVQKNLCNNKQSSQVQTALKAAHLYAAIRKDIIKAWAVEKLSSKHFGALLALDYRTAKKPSYKQHYRI